MQFQNMFSASIDAIKTVKKIVGVLKFIYLFFSFKKPASKKPESQTNRASYLRIPSVQREKNIELLMANINSFQFI